ncbi:hypothetical protein CcCBS67573_g06211 [Chytriomyces confervae]|uniref:GATA-type domain-containing protein n=1 Tax=Chytriomyces confervae TaxID=246404 RepID=A0A507F6M6_9FUNG|nr:putative electron transfer flavoprotein subunit [Chytriomyces hyalinus]TPX71335.1 hypothetical protein CcCBS67573_g06211 [Chytriomyces confervae]
MNNLHQQQQQQLPSPDMMKLLELLGNSSSHPTTLTQQQQPGMRQSPHFVAPYPKQSPHPFMPAVPHAFSPVFGAMMMPSFAFPAFDAFGNSIPLAAMDTSVFDRMLNDVLLFDAFSAVQQQQQQQQSPVAVHNYQQLQPPPHKVELFAEDEATHNSFEQQESCSHEIVAGEGTCSPHFFQETSPPQTVSLRSISSMSPSASPSPASPVSNAEEEQDSPAPHPPTPSLPASPVPVNIQLTPFLATPAAVCKKSGSVAAGAISKKAKKQHVCFNCATDTTPMWRRDDLGRRVCNACGVYYRMNGVNRVVKAGTVPIQRRRNRAKGGKLSGKRKKAQQHFSYDDDEEEDEE